MDHFTLIQHPLDRFSLTGSMAGLDASERDSVDKLMTMIGDLQFCKADIRGTCARYFIFVNSAWFCKLCFTASIDSGKLWSYLWEIEYGEPREVCDIVNDEQLFFCFPGAERPPTVVKHVEHKIDKTGSR